MKIYQVGAIISDGVAVGYVTNKKDIHKMFKKLGGKNTKDRTIHVIEFEPTKKGIVEMLNIYTPKMDNG